MFSRPKLPKNGVWYRIPPTTNNEDMERIWEALARVARYPTEMPIPVIIYHIRPRWLFRRLHPNEATELESSEVVWVGTLWSPPDDMKDLIQRIPPRPYWLVPVDGTAYDRYVHWVRMNDPNSPENRFAAAVTDCGGKWSRGVARMQETAKLDPGEWVAVPYEPPVKF